MSTTANKFVLDPTLPIDQKYSVKARKFLQRECVDNLKKIHIKEKGEKNLRKQVKNLFQDKTMSGFYIDEKNIYGMIVLFDESSLKFAGAYIARVNGVLSIYDSNIRFSVHSVERLILRLQMKNPRLGIAKAIHSVTKYLFCPEKDFAINIEEKWRTPGLNEVDIAKPYLGDNDELLGMFFLTSISNLNCTRVEAGVVKTFVDTNKLREEQYSKCMEVYEAQRNAFISGKANVEMSRIDLLMS